MPTKGEPIGWTPKKRGGSFLLLPDLRLGLTPFSRWVPRFLAVGPTFEGCGQAATSSRGYIEYVSGRAEFRPIARTTPMLILENGGDRPVQSLFEHRGSCRRTLPADPCLLSPTSALERITDSSQTSCQVRNVPTRDSCTAAMAAFNAPGTCDDCGGHVESDRSPREGHQSHGSFKPCVNFFP